MAHEETGSPESPRGFRPGPGPLGVITITPTPRAEADKGDDIGARYAATRQATEDLDAVDELEAEFGTELDAEEAGQEPEPEPAKAKTETEEGGADVGAILSDIGRGVIELPLQTLGGLRDAAQETLEFVDSLAKWLDTHVADLTVMEFDEPIGFPEIPQAESVTGGISRGILQFVFGMIGAGKITGLSKLKNLSKLQTAGRLGIQGAIADGIARNPNEENLANLLRELTDEQESAVLNFLASDPDDNEALARLKKSFEGFFIGALVDAVILGVGTVRAVRGLKKVSAQEQKAAVGSGEGRSQPEIDALVKSTETVRGKEAGVAALAATPLGAEREPEREGEVKVASLVGAIFKGLAKAGAKEAAKEAPVFFSNAGKAIDGAKFEKGTAEQWLALSGLKKEEIEFTGLDEFLRSQKGSVSKQEVLDFLDQNGVKLGEVVKGGEGVTGRLDLEDEFVNQQVSQFRIELTDIGGGDRQYRIFDPNGRTIGDFGIVEGRRSGEPLGFANEADATRRLRDILFDTAGRMDEDELASRVGVRLEEVAPGGPTKFETYTLPGGENYRELLITLPAKRAVTSYRVLLNKDGVNFDVIRRIDDEDEVYLRAVPRNEADDAARFGNENDVGRLATSTFTGGHYDEPNVLVHVRFNERTIQTRETVAQTTQRVFGKEFDQLTGPEQNRAIRINSRASSAELAPDQRILFIEEIQSDWHAKGRRQGYLRTEDVGKFEVFNTTTARVRATFDTEDEARAFMRTQPDPGRLDFEVAGQGGIAGNAVPDAPFKKTWHELGLKRMVRYAAENDFDSVAWTSGAQQADRYDLSKHISSIGYQRRGDLTNVTVWGKNGEQVLNNQSADARWLEDNLGKEMAEKIAKGEGRLQTQDIGEGEFRFLEDLDLRVGGEGLKTFYDRMLPQAVNRIGKKFGAKAGETNIAGENPEFFRSGDVRGAAQQRKTMTSIHTFPITPELKDEVLKNGLPLFSSGAALTGLTAQDIDVSPPDILLSDPFVPGEPRAGEEIQVAGVFGPLVRGFRKAQAGADEITRQRTGPGAAPQTLVGDVQKPLIEIVEDTPPERFLDTTGGPRLPEKAININLGKLDTTDDIKRAIDETANLFGKEIDEARRGVQTNEATAALASDMGMTVEKLLSRRRGEAFNAETALAARRMLASSASQLVDLAKKAADNGGDRELLAFRRAMVVHKAIQEQVSGLTAEAGRALQSFRILAGSEREMVRNVQEMIDAAGGSRVSRKMAERLAAADGTLSRAQLNEVVRKGALARTSDVFLEVWINALLSGPQTQAVNILSNALVAAWQIPTRFIASKLPGGGADAVAAGEAKVLLYGMMRGYSEGLILAGRAVRTGESTDVLSKIDLPQRRAISAEAFNMSGTAGQAIDFLGEVVRLPGRFLLAGDELFKSVGYRMEVSARAFRQAASEGLEGDAMARRMDEIMRNPPEDIRLASIDAGRYQTFTKPLGEGGQAYQSVVNAVPILRLLTPFIRTPVNIMKFVGEGTVLAPLSKNVRAEFTAGAARRQIMMAKIAMGSMASAFAADMAARGLFTGNGPSNPDTRKIWLTTHQPNSIKVGDEWVAYGRLEPLGAFFGIAADIQMIMGDLDEPDRQNLATALVISISKNVTSKTFLRGLSEAARTLNDPDRFGERYIQQLVGTAIPSIVAQVARVQDPVLRDVRTMYDKLCSRVPGCSTTLPPRRNIWGEIIERGGGLGPDIISPIYTNEIKVNPVSDEILRLGVGQQMPSRQIGGVELTPQEYDEYSRLAGQSSLKELTKLMKRPDYKTASDGPDGLKALAIKKVFAATRAEARGKILKNREFRGLRDRVEERDDERRKKLRAPSATGIQLPASP